MVSPADFHLASAPVGTSSFNLRMMRGQSVSATPQTPCLVQPRFRFLQECASTVRLETERILL
jgi:hypothetical protein